MWYLPRREGARDAGVHKRHANILSSACASHQEVTQLWIRVGQKSSDPAQRQDASLLFPLNQTTEMGEKTPVPAIIPKKFIPPNIAAALSLYVHVVLFFFLCLINCTLPLTDCLEGVLILNFYTLPEEKYVGSKLILFLSHG